jgi:dipeptidase E
MPVVEPPSFNAFNLVPVQINPHYTDANPPGHAGETREERIMEFLTANPGVTVLGLREGCMFRVEGKTMSLIGERTVRVFQQGRDPMEMDASADFSKFLG